MPRRAALVVLLPALAGCFGSGSSGPQPAELPALDPAREVRVRWSAAVGAAGAFVFQPARAGDVQAKQTWQSVPIAVKARR